MSAERTLYPGHTRSSHISCLATIPSYDLVISASYANDLDTAVKIWDMNSGLCVWSVNDKSVLAVYKLFIAAASSTIFVGHSLGKVSVYQLHGQSAIALGCRPTAKADDAQTISAATSLSQTSESTSLLVDLGSAISDEGIFECHSSSGNIRCLVAFSNGQRFFTSAFDDSLDRSIKCFSLQNEHPLLIANTKGMRVNRLLLTNDEEILVSGHIGEVCLWKSADLLKLSSISAVGLPSNIVHHQAASFSCLAISDLTDTKPQFLFTACYNDERDCDIRRWRLGQGLEQPRCVATSPHEASYLPIFQLELSPNATKVLTAHSSGRISLWDSETMKLEKLISFVNGSACVTCLVVDRKWTTFSAISNSESTASGIFCYDLINNEEKRRFVCDALPQRMVYSHDGCHLIAGYSDGCIRKWNIRTGQMHLIFRSGWGEESACGCAIF